jgi:hypothetical protein
MPTKLTNHELTQRLAMFYAAVDTLCEAHAAIETLPIYRHEFKNLCGKMMREIDRVQLDVMRNEHMKDVAYSQNWLDLKPLASVWVNAVYNTPMPKMPELFAVINAYVAGEIKFED